MTARQARAELGRVLAQLDAVFDDLDPVATVFREIIASRRSAAEQATHTDLSVLRPMIMSVLTTHGGWAAGAGVITAPGLLRSTPRWLEWWWNRPSGGVEALRANLDEEAPDFYDYTTAEWYLVPAMTHARHAAGPYVDYLCTNEYSVTLSSPIFLDGELIGIAGADVLVASIEQRVVPVLSQIASGAVLTNGEGRVIASATPLLAAGHRLDLTDLVSERIRRRQKLSGADAWQLVLV